jgi:hypothetical protein
VDLLHLKRIEVEMGGIVLDGIKYPTDKEAQFQYISMAIEGREERLVIAVRTHIEKCYKREFELRQMGKPYDLDAGWPPND